MLKLLLVVLCCSSFCDGALPTLDGRIVGGMDTDIINYPYQLSLEYLGTHLCGASLISARWAVTAAHCTDGSFTAFLSVRAGTSIDGIGGQLVRVKSKHQHKLYNRRTIDYDISVLELASPITHPLSKPVSLPTKEYSVNVGDMATVTGWGLTSEGGSLSKVLKVVHVSIISQTQCREAYGYADITDRMFCAGNTSGGKDACQGDSGGPLVVNGLLVGIISWGYGCARSEYPGVYTNVSLFRDYVSSISGI